ncbi:MAG: YbdD/YjiX family protein [Proteobacteria bacterium]|nr:YbdD/YjiX family protein [Pseudomonadota bacterium]
MSGAQDTGPGARLKAARRAFKQMFGIPDFERYCEHLREHHPERPLPTEREFHAMAIDRRYGAARPRCC